MDAESFDLVVIGAGLRGLGAALASRRSDPHAALLVVDRAPRVGGEVQTLRSNGFVCELGPFAFARDDVAPLLSLLAHPPRLVEALPTAARGHRYDGNRLLSVDVDPTPVSFASGTEELPQACRRELGAVLRLGRTATAVQVHAHGFELTLGGEVPGRVRARRLTLALPPAAAGELLAPFDRELAACAGRIGAEPRAFVFLGGHRADAPELHGFGIAPADGVDSPVAETVFCTEVFAQRALPGRLLLRAEVAGAAVAGDDAAVIAAVEAELRRWTGTTAKLPFAKVHRFAVPADAAAEVECRTRLAALAARIDGLSVA